MPDGTSNGVSGKNGLTSPSSWWSERFFSAFKELGLTPYLSEGYECLRSRRAIEFSVLLHNIFQKVW